MDKKELRRQIRDLKRAMNEELIEEKSRRLGELLCQSELHRHA